MTLRARGDGPPVWQQYQRFKRQHPDAILLFRLGDFYETFDAAAELISREPGRIGAAEVLVPATDPRRGLPPDLPPELANGFRVTPLEAWRFGAEAASARLKSHFGVLTLEGFGCADESPAAGAAGALIQYVADTNPGALGHLDGLRSYDL